MKEKIKKNNQRITKKIKEQKQTKWEIKKKSKTQRR